MKRITLIIAGILNVYLLASQGIYNLWGMTAHGGPDDVGVIFKANGRGDNFTGIHDFNSATGKYPYGTLTYFKGKLYGMARYGAASDRGLIFEVDPITGIYSEKYISNDAVAGFPGDRNLVAYNDKLYGGGFGGTAGVIFEWDPATNIYTKKVELTGQSGAAPGTYCQWLSLIGDKFYGYTMLGGANNQGVLFEWDPGTNIYTKKIDLVNPFALGNSLAYLDGKFYGTTIGDGANSYGTIFEWDIAGNAYTTKIDFNLNGTGIGTPGVEGASPLGGLTLSGQKLYGTTLDGGMYQVGNLFEWNPATNIPDNKYDMDGATAKWPMSRITAFNNRLYGFTTKGGANDMGTFFEFDLDNNVFTPKIDFDGMNANAPVEGNALTVVPAPVAAVAPGICTGIAGVTVDNSNNNTWVPVTDNVGDAIAEIKANGNDLGNVSIDVYKNNGAVREDGANRLYLDRNFTITPQQQPVTPVDIRLYISTTEFESLKAATNSLGQPSGINTINDLAIFKNSDGCIAALSSAAAPVTTTAEEWLGGYVLSASISSFSSFYIAANTNVALPLDFISFEGRLDNTDAVLTWETANEHSVSHFEIQRSSDGHKFERAGSVHFLNAVHRYTFIDKHIPSTGGPIVYYRIKEWDINGSFAYSTIVTLSLKRDEVLFLYPNPASGQATLNITFHRPESILLQLTDNNGKLLRQQRFNLPAGRNLVPVDVNGLPVGIYYLELSNNSYKRQLKLIKQ